jgi:AcrR family transcriptional regulator
VAATTRQLPQQARARATIEHILDTAERLFHERGVDAVTTNDLCAAAELSPGRLYYWFPDRYAIVAAVEERAERLVGEFLTAKVLNDVRSPTSEVLRRILYPMADLVRLHPGVLPVLRRHRAPGSDVPETPLNKLFIALASGILAERVDTETERGRQMVATTCVTIAVGMLQLYARVPDPDDKSIIDELIYVLSCYLYSRYPAVDDHVWSNPSYALQPRCPARPSSIAIVPVFPADFDRAFATPAAASE